MDVTRVLVTIALVYQHDLLSTITRIISLSLSLPPAGPALTPTLPLFPLHSLPLSLAPGSTPSDQERYPETGALKSPMTGV